MKMINKENIIVFVITIIFLLILGLAVYLEEFATKGKRKQMRWWKRFVIIRK